MPKVKTPSAPQSSRTSIRTVFALVLICAGVLWGFRDQLGLGSPDVNSHVPSIEPPAAPTVGIDRAIVAAIERARDKVVKSPETTVAWGRLGMTFFTHEMVSQASICFAQAEKLSPTEAQWPYLLGLSLSLSDPNESIVALERAVKVCGNQPAAPRLRLVEKLLELYRLEEAESHLTEFMSEYPDEPRARVARARLAYLRDDAEFCLKELQALGRDIQRGRQRVPKLKSMLTLMAQAQRRLGRVQEAERVSQLAIAEKDFAWPDPYLAECRQYRTGLKKHLVDADKLYGRREYERSITLLETTLAQYPDSIWGRIMLARALIHTGSPQARSPDAQQRLARAERLLNDVLEEDPNSVEALFRLGVAQTYKGNRDEAIELYQRAVAIKPDLTMAHFNLANELRLQGDIAGAAEALKHAVRSQPDFANGHYWLGDALMRQGLLEEAEDHFAMAVQLQPNQAAMQKALRRVRAMRRENDESINDNAENASQETVD